ncbi:unnamed protein product [Effrenium voratum]|uniref:Uncharacterized protein n=1 Tax=Effrenium voratum TaxID=2562239 RepID=A0AA36I8I3_9DINO|nr:unnamed protein product [Effrenium voratum]
MPSLAACLLASFERPSVARQRPQSVEHLLQAALSRDVEDEAATAPRCRGKYVSTSVKDRARWAKELRELKDAQEERGQKLGAALVAWIWREFPGSRNDKREFSRIRTMCYHLLEEGTAKRLLDAADNGEARKRRRVSGGGRKPLAMDVGHELFQWFVDTAASSQLARVRNVKCRLTSRLLEAQARVILQDYREVLQIHFESGVSVPGALDQLPKINRSWVQRWRKQFRISWRARTVAYKVSRQKLKERLGVLWRNSIRLRVLHQCLFPSGKLRFRSYDQKPLWHNAVGGQKTLALKGAKDVDIKENVHATRCRFTAMTKAVQISGETLEDACARSSGSGDPNQLAVLFKADTDRIKANLDVPSGCLVQTGPKGSYRVEQVLEFLRWDLGAADSTDGSCCEVVCLDWFSAHLDPEVDKLIKDLGHVPLKLGGGSTPFVAVLDTHAHWSYESAYRDAETHDAQLQLRRGYALPCTSRQTVLSRAVDCWRQVKHDKVADGWLAAGLTNALDGSQDHLISRVCLPFWTELQMDLTRSQLVAEIKDAVKSGQLLRWSDYTQVLEPYDEHEGLIEGEETGRERMVEAPPGQELEIADEGYDSPEAEGEELPEDCEEPLLAEASVAQQAKSEIAVENDKKRLEQLLSMRSAAKTIGDLPTVRFLDSRVAEVSRAQARPNEIMSAHLREKALERRQMEAQVRIEQQAARDRSKQLLQEEKNAKLKLEIAKVEKSTAMAAAQKDLEDAKLARSQEQKRREEQARVALLTKKHFAAKLANQLLDWALFSPNEAEQSVLARAVKASVQRRAGEKSIVVPEFVEASRAMAALLLCKDLVIVNPNAGKADVRVFASESFCWSMATGLRPGGYVVVLGALPALMAMAAALWLVSSTGSCHAIDEEVSTQLGCLLGYLSLLLGVLAMALHCFELPLQQTLSLSFCFSIMVLAMWTLALGTSRRCVWASSILSGSVLLSFVALLLLDQQLIPNQLHIPLPALACAEYLSVAVYLLWPLGWAKEVDAGWQLHKAWRSRPIQMA